uniref:Uncharacterized protein n=1 Tax=Caenorhabditis japonica TaxID=281687 RepID=A0A8R1IN50_CAEJA
MQIHPTTQEAALALGDILSPQIRPMAHLSSVIPGKAMRLLDIMTDQLPFLDDVWPSIVNVYNLPKAQEKLLLKCPQVLQDEPADEETALREMVRAARHGLTASIAAEQDNKDPRWYPTTIDSILPSATGPVAVFDLATQSGPAQIAFWQRNSQFHLTTDRGRKIIMEVDHSVTVTGTLRVHARFATINKLTSKETMDILNAQVTATQTKELHPGWLRLFPENDFLSGVPRDSSAWKLAKAVADGGRLHRRPPCDTSLPQVCDFLNDPQREYCQMHLLDQNAATLANSPPGVGKTVMISAAAIAASSIFPGKLNIICGVTNASASETVVKLAELEANNPVRFTRLISGQNRQRQRDSTHSDADYPELWKRVLAIALLRFDDSALNGVRYDVKIAQNAMFHLKKARAPVPPLKSKDLLKVVKQRIPDKDQMTREECFFKIHQTSVLVGTVFPWWIALPSMGSVRKPVATVQVDEA